MKKGWETKRLGDFAAAVSTGPFGSILHKSDYVDDGVPLVNPINIVGDSIVPDPSKLISEVTIKRLSNYVLEEGDIVLGRRGEIGRCAVIGPNERGWVCGTGSFFIRPLPSLDAHFLAHLIRSPEYRERLEKLSTGATMKNLSNTVLGDLVVSVPPLAEQERIVGVLDEAFADLATAQANAEKNLQNARALFESYLQSVFTHRGKGWVEKTLGDVCEFVGGSQPPKAVFSKTKTPNSIRLIQIRDYKSDKHVVYIPKAQARRFCTADDIMIGRYGPPIFQILRGLEGAYNVALMKAVPDETQVNREFLFYFLKHPAILQHVIYHSERAAGQIGVTKETLAPYPIALPSLDKQADVAADISALASDTQQLARIYEQKQAALAELKKSLLHQAFSGNL